MKIKLTIFLAILTTLTFSKVSTDKESKADNYYKTGELLTAIKLYSEAEFKYKEVSKLKIAKGNTKLKADKETAQQALARVSKKIGNCYMQMRDYLNASKWLQKAIGARYENYYDKKIYYDYAKSVHSQGKYDEAIKNLEIFQKDFPKDELGRNLLTSCYLAQKWTKNIDESDFKEVEQRPAPFSSTDRDYSPMMGDAKGEVFYFTSNRKGVSKKTDKVTGEKYTDIFMMEKNSQGKWSEPKPIDNPKISTPYSDGNPSFTGDFGTMFFTHCEKDEMSPCKIFKATQKEGKWDNVEVVKFPGADSCSYGHPTINPNGDTLIFSSDKKGGFGGKDLWSIYHSDTSWSTPKNLGRPINTKGDEVFPYLRNDGVLFFSSDGHPGMGGVDIFEVIKKDTATIVENLKAPLNSYADDHGITFDKLERTLHTGYFSSSRGSKLEDNIFHFARYPKEFILRIFTFDSEKKTPIEGAKVKIFGTDGTDKNDIFTNENGYVEVPLNEETKYVYAARKEGYLIDKDRSSTIGLKDQYKDIFDTLNLIPTIKPIVIPNIFFQKNSDQLLKESASALDKLLKILKDNPEIVIELGSHCDYVGNSAHNLQLSQKRSETVVNYLINKGIIKERLYPKGFGEENPYVVNKAVCEQYPYLDEGMKLDSTTIEKLVKDEQKDQAKALNRRTEIKVLSADDIQMIKEGTFYNKTSKADGLDESKLAFESEPQTQATKQSKKKSTTQDVDDKAFFEPTPQVATPEIIQQPLAAPSEKDLLDQKIQDRANELTNKNEVVWEDQKYAWLDYNSSENAKKEEKPIIEKKEVSDKDIQEKVGFLKKKYDDSFKFKYNYGNKKDLIIQVAAFKDYNRSMKLRDAIKDENYITAQEKVEIEGVTWFRVYLIYNGDPENIPKLFDKIKNLDVKDNPIIRKTNW